MEYHAKTALPKIFSSVSKRTLAPGVAIIAVVTGAILFLFIGDLKSIANLTNFTVFSVFIAVNLSLIYFRIKKPRSKGFRVPLNIKNIPILAIFGILTSFFMILNISFRTLLLGILLILIGIIFYFILSKFSSTSVN